MSPESVKLVVNTCAPLEESTGVYVHMSVSYFIKHDDILNERDVL